MPDLSQRHTFGIASQCRTLYEFSSVQQLLELYPQLSPCYVMGEGSNTIFVEDFDGQVLINRITGVTATPMTIAGQSGIHLSVGAGENWHALVQYTVEQGWGGLENLALIPGSVGAAPIQNIGAYGLEVGERILDVEVVDVSSGRLFKLTKDECEFAYRDSIFKRDKARNWVVVKVDFWLPDDVTPIATYAELAALSNPDAAEIYHQVIAIRQRKLPDPKQLGNAGSFFKNPTITRRDYQNLQASYPGIPGFIVSADAVKVPAAWLIDNAGLKGVCIGGACSYQQQPLVLVNQGEATGEAVIALAKKIIATVKSQFGVTLAPEVRLIGKQGRIVL
ncbi:UDP-N-acetylmuramate dehydrogenase [Alteromonas gilva]|uniref:UDP-N-acetylenolpyruvoylglucosamine reductase n=1 Tax=Alteromonas gilva TaxID=2987522 RepID=A0ABT5L589_9ALTE|nr:UDP-N-acetylmuramate dehydrogenase [Alteromonas gilva]MDC8832205.1 UDP-N-acetylmuramate dehydrogenase [Alteromonas gilva]